MKVQSKLYEFLIFIIIFIFCILPPFFYINSQNLSFNSWSFPLEQLCFAIFALILLKICTFLRTSLTGVKNVKEILYKVITPASFCLALLFLTALLFKVISNSFETHTVIPDNVIKFIFCIINFFCAAIYEEIVYRFYFTDALKRIFNYKYSDSLSSKLYFLMFEISGAVVFAFAHFYLGVLSTLNAFIAHFILRYFYKKSKNLWVCIAAHFLYNLLTLFLF
jgi:membrane protease YdiL (CAAX protease family)